MPDPDRILKTHAEAAQLFRATPGRNGTIIDLDKRYEDVVVAGDLHGNLQHFKQILDYANLDRNRSRHLVLQELVHGSFRYEDGGCKSHQLLDVVSALKCQYPDRLHVLLGNHELSEIENRPIVKGGEPQNELFRRGIERAYGNRVDDIRKAYVELFQSWPLAVRTHNQVFVSHSIPNKKMMHDGFDMSVFKARSIRDLPGTRGSSMYALVWGRDTDEENALEFTKRLEVNLLITGHIPCDNGYETPNSVQLILDSAHTPAAFCSFSNKKKITLNDLVSGVHML